jgi:hypothetical protein
MGKAAKYQMTTLMGDQYVKFVHSYELYQSLSEEIKAQTIMDSELSDMMFVLIYDGWYGTYDELKTCVENLLR